MQGLQMEVPGFGCVTGRAATEARAETHAGAQSTSRSGTTPGRPSGSGYQFAQPLLFAPAPLPPFPLPRPGNLVADMEDVEAWREMERNWHFHNAQPNKKSRQRVRGGKHVSMRKREEQKKELAARKVAKQSIGAPWEALPGQPKPSRHMAFDDDNHPTVTGAAIRVTTKPIAMDPSDASSQGSNAPDGVSNGDTGSRYMKTSFTYGCCAVNYQMAGFTGYLGPVQKDDLLPPHDKGTGKVMSDKMGWAEALPTRSNVQAFSRGAADELRTEMPPALDELYNEELYEVRERAVVKGTFKLAKALSRVADGVSIGEATGCDQRWTEPLVADATLSKIGMMTDDYTSVMNGGT